MADETPVAPAETPAKAKTPVKSKPKASTPVKAAPKAKAPASAPAKAPVKAKAPAPASGPSKDIKRAAILLKSVSDPTRLQVVSMLTDGPLHVGAMCSALDSSQPAVSHHLALLRHGRIIEPTRSGKNNFYSLTDQGLALAKVIKAIVGSA